MRYVSAYAANSRQRGIILPIVVGALLALLAVAALALDPGHAFLNKTRLQNALDAGALAGAKVLETTQDEVGARAAAQAMFERNAGEPGNDELLSAMSGATLTTETSRTLNPFVAGSGPAEYLRVRAEGLQLDSWFAQVVGLAEMNLAGSAVAGPAPVECPDNLVPMMICGDPDPAAGSAYGYELGQVTVLKTSAGGESPVGPGNFQLIRLDGGPGADSVRNGLAGNYEQTGCSAMASGGTIETEPGNAIGPVAQGLNTRFGEYSGPISPGDYPPDTVTTQANYNPSTPDAVIYRHPDYLADQQAGNYTHPDGVAGRRELAVAVGDCSDTTNGQGQVPLLGFGCFFLLDPVSHQGNTAEVYGEFIETCASRGDPAADPGIGLGVPRQIVLHKDPDSDDS